MAWVRRLHFSNQYLNLKWLEGTFSKAPGQINHFSTTERSWYVSSSGRCRDSRGRLTLGHRRPDGYRVLCIFGHPFLVHRVVAFAFLGPAAESLASNVHHRDGNRSNNRLDNLAYVTHAENVWISYHSNPSRGTSGASLSKPVMWRDLEASDASWNSSFSIASAAKMLGVSTSTVAKHCRTGMPMGSYQLKFAPPREACLLGEQWLPMKNPLTGHVVKGRYVSSFGRLRSCAGLISRGHKNKSGYVETNLSDGCKIGKTLVHRLVAYAFLGPPPSFRHSQVNHKDLNRGNNHIENLEYVTPSENVKHFHTNKTTSVRSATRKPVLARPYGSEDDWVLYPSMLNAAQLLGLQSGQVSRCARSLQKRAGSYEFRLADCCEESTLPDEEWRAVDLEGLMHERVLRTF